MSFIQTLSLMFFFLLLIFFNYHKHFLMCYYAAFTTNYIYERVEEEKAEGNNNVKRIWPCGNNNCIPFLMEVGGKSNDAINEKMCKRNTKLEIGKVDTKKKKMS